MQWNKGDCVITDRAASRRKYNARYFFSRMKALNAATIPEFNDRGVNAPNLDDNIYRQREWSFFNTRPGKDNYTTFSTTFVLIKILWRTDL